MDARLEDIKLSSLREIVPQTLISRLEVFGVNNIGSLFNIDVQKFQNFPNVGKRTLDDLYRFLTLIEKDPEQIKMISSECQNDTSFKIIPLKFSDSMSPLECFAEIVNDYFKLLKVDRDREIVFSRFGVDGEKQTFCVIGNYFEITNERVRQITESQIETLRYLVEGKKHKKLNCIVHKSALDKLNLMLTTIRKFEALTRDDAKQICAPLSSQITYINLLMEITGFRRVETRTNDLYVKQQYSNRLSLNLIREILLILSSSKEPLPESDLIEETLKNVPNGHEATQAVILQLCRNMKEIEIIEVANHRQYQIKFEYLKNLESEAYRVMNESEQTQPLHYSAIATGINLKRAACKSSHETVRSDSVKSRLCDDPAFAAIGRTGNWALAKWEANTDRIADLIEKALIAAGEPITAEEIYEIISSFKREIRKKSISSIIGKEKHRFLRHKDHKYILKEWEDTYKEYVIKRVAPRSSVRTKEIVKEKILSIFKHDNFKEINVSELRIAVVTECKCANGTFYKAMAEIEGISRKKHPSKRVTLTYKEPPDSTTGHPLRKRTKGK